MSNTQEYCLIKPESELLLTLAQAEKDVKAGKVAPMQETFNNIRNKLLEMEHGK